MITHTEYAWEWVDGVSLTCLDTGQSWDASYWTRGDWEEFIQPNNDKIAQAEMMEAL